MKLKRYAEIEADGTTWLFPWGRVEDGHTIVWFVLCGVMFCHHLAPVPDGWTANEVWDWVDQGLDVPSDGKGDWAVTESTRVDQCEFCVDHGISW